MSMSVQYLWLTRTLSTVKGETAVVVHRLVQVFTMDSETTLSAGLPCEICSSWLCKRGWKKPVIFVAIVFVLFSIWNLRQQIRNSNTYPVFSDVTVKEKCSTGESVKVLVLAYFRTGSTLTSELIQQTNGTFYVFEPFWALQFRYSKTDQVPVLINGTKWPEIRDGLKYQVHVLQSLFNCDITSVDKPALEQFSVNSLVLSKFPHCFETIQECANDIRTACLKAPIRMVKTIRTPMKLVPELLKKDPCLRVIHLLRDPRGLIQSWLKVEGVEIARELIPQHVCDLVQDDLETRLDLEKQYPGTFLEVIYEDLAQHPVDMLHKIYKWLGVAVEPGVIDWTVKRTNADQDGQTFDTFRKNSTASAYSWVNTITFKGLKLINRVCGELIAHGRFPVLSSETELAEFRVPYRKLS